VKILFGKKADEAVQEIDEKGNNKGLNKGKERF